MEVVIQDDAGELGRLGAKAVIDTLANTPDAVLGLATGSSPVSIYDAVAAAVAAGSVSLARSSAFTLDEYVGLPPGHPQSYRSVILRDFVDKVDLDPGRLHTPDGAAADIPAACAAYEGQIADAGGIDLQILGIGADGHVAFNEPGSSLASRTRIKTLTQQTRVDNARFFDGDVDAVPSHCVTQGVGTIMQARHLLLIASGRHKAQAVHQLVEGPITAMWPASVLQLHPHVTVLVDRAAASRLQLTDYYRDAFANKPDWQGF
ncbi:glucosamine-6-phosphate deaminase [Calidifontibacter sp. DB0510]|uniref:Glucosamine-6-phosphate deaminase n=1 Tax=Metallococcus carri TaxID=1656884 RepID=A0A967B317_9MICO|nr:glucosamine-6-phosphate deaminase [Metallococcus carri]NHN56465.1 glucosamine-6-phosphate deaminase [Metallococcus carri]NOP36089.1 glucosamine-6-phosphate deaminase [Calidifontibacter sp. DB2511S]